MIEIQELNPLQGQAGSKQLVNATQIPGNDHVAHNPFSTSPFHATRKNRPTDVSAKGPAQPYPRSFHTTWQGLKDHMKPVGVSVGVCRIHFQLPWAEKPGCRFEAGNIEWDSQCVRRCWLVSAGTRAFVASSFSDTEVGASGSE